LLGGDVDLAERHAVHAALGHEPFGRVQYPFTPGTA
jgi:hypothetical protein